MKTRRRPPLTAMTPPSNGAPAPYSNPVTTIHKTPRSNEIRASRPWLEAELQSLAPRCIVCLGATAAGSLLGPQARVIQLRGEVIANTAWAPAVVVTVHPSAVLRADDAERYFDMLVADLKLARAALEAAGS